MVSPAYSFSLPLCLSLITNHVAGNLWDSMRLEMTKASKYALWIKLAILDNREIKSKWRIIVVELLVYTKISK